LPRLSLVLETIKKHTEADHPDLDTLPLILTILSDFIKSTQPGIAAAESKVKFWSLCESLVFQKGEIIVCFFLFVFYSLDASLLKYVVAGGRIWTCMMRVGRWFFLVH
jgi:hypothetical protein